MNIKFNCSNNACRQRLSVDESLAGALFSCPKCGTSQPVPSSRNIKFDCTNSDCRQHLVVDVSESGRFIKCPSCGKPLQIPGAPPKSIVSWQVSHAEEKASPKTPPAPFNPLQRLLYGWGTGLALILCCLAGSYLRSWAVLPPRIKAISREIYSNGDLRDAPIEDYSGMTLLYAQDIPQGLAVFFVNLVTLHRTQIGLIKGTGQADERVFTPFGWSPDNRYLAYFAQPDQKHQQIVLCYGSTGIPKNSFSTLDGCGSIDKGIWLTTNSLALLTHAHDLYLFNLENDASRGAFGKKGLVKLRSLSYYDASWIVPVTEHSVAYFNQGNLWTLDIPTGRAFQLTHLPHGKPEWLDYNPDNGKYYFCFTRLKEEINRVKKDGPYVYEYDSRGSPDAGPIQLNTNRSGNVRWLKNGAGIACAESQGRTNYLAIKNDEAILTNLFWTSGYLRSYSLNPDRDKLYAVAADGYKLMSIWEFDIAKKSLRDILPMEEEYALRKAVSAVSASITNQDGDKVDYYVVPPAKLDPHKKYPLILDQFTVDRYDQNVQFLSNAGIFYASAHPFGFDAYVAPKLEDTLLVYHELLKNPNVDPHRIYISGHSYSTVEASELVDEYPDLWRGMILETPVSFPKIPDQTGTYPSIFISIGDNDLLWRRKDSESLMQDACRHLVPARINYQHSAHTYHTRQFSDEYAEIANFILTDY